MSERLAERQQIYDLITSYCRGVDRLDLEAVRDVYWPDGVDNHTGFSGARDDYVAFLERVLPVLDGTMHMICNHRVDFFGETAVGETYAQAVHWGTPDDDPRKNFTSGVRYIDHLERRAGTWRIKERWAAREWTHSDAALRMPKGAPGPVGSRTEDDPLTALLARVRASQ